MERHRTTLPISLPPAGAEAGAGALINEDPYITATEKNLERSLMNWREERVKTMLAKKNDAKDEEVLHIRKELDLLLFSLGEFRLILEPFELDNYITAHK